MNGENDNDVAAWYRAVSSETTPERLDHDILAAAGRAVSRRHRHWPAILAAAASAVLAVGLVLQVSTTPQSTDASLHLDSVSEDAARVLRETESRARLQQGSLEAEPSKATVKATSPVVGVAEIIASGD